MPGAKSRKAGKGPAASEAREASESVLETTQRLEREVTALFQRLRSDLHKHFHQTAESNASSRLELAKELEEAFPRLKDADRPTVPANLTTDAAKRLATNALSSVGARRSRAATAEELRTPWLRLEKLDLDDLLDKALGPAPKP